LTPIEKLKSEVHSTMKKDDRCRFAVDDVVKTIKGAKFWGRVVSVYQVSPGDWRVVVMATHIEFYGMTINVPDKELDFRSTLA